MKLYQWKVLLSAIITCVFLSLGTDAGAQCTNATSVAGSSAPTPGNTVTVTTAMRAGRYAQVTSVAANWDYQATSSKSSDFITIHQGTYNGPIIASGTQPLDWTSTVAGDYFIHCNTNSSCGTQNTNRTIQLYAYPTMTYQSCTTTQASTDTAQKCDLANKVILSLQVVTTGSLSPISATQFTLRTNGSSAPVADIANIRIYYTGTSNTFATSNPFGSAAPAASGTNIPVSGNQVLAAGTNYFWVAYDLDATATLNNLLDAQCMAMVVAGTSRTPSTTNPTGSRTIKACPPSPGGVGSGILLWLRPDAGVTTSGVNVTAWADQSTAATATIINGSPDKIAVGRNFNPTILFTLSNGVDGGDFVKLSDLDVQSFFCTAQLSDVNRKSTHMLTWDRVTFAEPCTGCAIHGGENGGSKAQYGELGYGNAKFQTAGVWRRNGNATGLAYNSEHSGNFDIVGALGTGTGSVNTVLGGQVSKTGFNGRVRDWLGPVGEMIIYGGPVTAAEANRVESYLAIKYGLTLGGNGATTLAYYSSANSLVWQANSGYHRNVIGIGRDDRSLLLQKQSRTEDDTTRIFLGTLVTSNQANTGSFPDDRAFVLVGHNGGKMCATTASLLDKPPGLYSRIERVWRVQNTNFSGSFNVSMAINTCANPLSVNPADLRLLVDLDGTFSDATVYGTGSGITFGYSGGMVTVSGISTSLIPANGTRFITIGSVNAATPLPIELVAFSAQCVGGEVSVKWTTASERDNALFTVESSIDGQSFLAAGHLPGSGTTSSMHHYAWTDHRPVASTSYYRLRQTDHDGTATLSSVVPVDCPRGADAVIWPNPATGHFLFNLPSSVDRSPMVVEMRDAIGRLVWHQEYSSTEGGQKQEEVDLHGFRAGAYFVSFNQGGRTWTQQLLVME